MNMDVLNKIREEKLIKYNEMKRISSLFLCNLNHKAGLSLIKYNASELNVFLDFIDLEYSDFYTLLNFKKEEIIKHHPKKIYILLDENYYLDRYGNCDNIKSVQNHISKLKDELNASLDLIDEIIPSKVDIVVSTLYLNEERLNQYISLYDRGILKDLVFDFNLSLVQRKKESKNNIFFVNMSGFHGETVEKIYSEYNTVASLDYLNFFTEKAIGFLRLSEGKSLKCIITDLDNTLWSGIVAEGEYDLIESHHQGAFRQYQRWLKGMHQQGVILSIASKNDMHIIKDFFSKNKNNLDIDWNDFSFPEINWENKSGNILNICKKLNISPEHVLFIDDSSYEVAEVKNAIPSINTFQFSGNIDKNISSIVGKDFFIKSNITSEDLLRNNSFANNIKRDELRKSESSNDNFLKNINMELVVCDCRIENAPRISDLTMRTNQFNMTTKRMDISEVNNYLSEDKSKHILTFNFKDRLGSYGIIGAAFFKIDSDKCFIENIVLSCRAFERGVEFAIIKSVASYASVSGCTQLIGNYIETFKNKRFHDFYKECGFSPIKNNLYKINIDKLSVSDNCKYINILGDENGTK